MRRLGGAWALLPMLVLAAPVAAQAPLLGRPEPGRFELRGMDFRPDGAWRRRVRAVQQEREAMLMTGAVQGINLATALGGRKVTGKFSVPVIPIAFRDAAPPYTAEEYQELFFNPAPNPADRPYSLKTYYEQLSNANIQLDGQVFPWRTADSAAAFYENNCNGVINCADGGRRFGNLLLQVLLQASSGGDSLTVWAAYDNDGADGLPNTADDDGVVDFVTFLQAKVDGACRTTGIWAHRWVISGWNGGSPFVTKTPTNSASARARGQRFISIDDYTMQSAVGGPSACDGSRIMPIGTVAHETGHAFGLPDLYDTDASNNTQGIGEWGLMGSGNYAAPFSPARYEAWSMAAMGWVVVDSLVNNRTVTTGPVATSDTIFYYRPPDGSGVYYLLENRQAVESDSVMLARGGSGTNWTRKAPGLLIWRVDGPRVTSGLASNRVNTGGQQGVVLMQADGLAQMQIAGGRNRGDAGDPFPGSTNNRRFASASNPAAVNNAGLWQGFGIDQIEQLPAGAMRFRFLRGARTQVASVTPGFSVRVGGQTTFRYEELLGAGDTLTISVDTLQLANNGRTRGRFLTWSNGGPRTQLLTIRPAGVDTVLASFSQEHQLQAVTSGPGTLTASIQGDVAAGVFLAAGTSVTLTAAPQAGQLFTGWSGDTLATSRTITVSMGRPYQLTANFLAVVPVSAEDVVQDILGTARLTAEQRTFLDQAGNRNGSYDLGDFLAFLDRSGTAPAPEVMARALSGAPFDSTATPARTPARGQ